MIAAHPRTVYNSGMKISRIRTILNAKPFRPVEILLDGGKEVVVRHPESVFVGKHVIVIESSDDSMEIFEPEYVSKIRALPRRRNGR